MGLGAELALLPQLIGCCLGFGGGASNTPTSHWPLLGFNGGASDTPTPSLSDPHCPKQHTEKSCACL